jgi:hypothetical protein
MLTVIGAGVGLVVFDEAAERTLSYQGSGPYSREGMARRDKIDAMALTGLMVGGLAGPVLGVAIKRLYWNNLVEGRELWTIERPSPPPASTPLSWTPATMRGWDFSPRHSE